MFCALVSKGTKRVIRAKVWAAALAWTIPLSACGGGSSPEDEAASLADFKAPILLRIQQDQYYGLQNGNCYAPSQADADSGADWSPHYYGQGPAHIDGYEFDPNLLFGWLLQKQLVSYVSRPSGIVPSVIVKCFIVSDTIGQYLSERDQRAGVSVHQGISLPLARREFVAWTYKKQFETSLIGRGSVEEFDGTFSYRMQALLPGVEFPGLGSATIRETKDPNSDRWIVEQFVKTDPQMTLR